MSAAFILLWLRLEHVSFFMCSAMQVLLQNFLRANMDGDSRIPLEKRF